MRRLARGALALSLALLAALPAPAASKPIAVPTKQNRRAVVEGDLFLRVPVPKKGGLASVAKKYTGDAKNEAALAKFNPVRKGRRLTEARVPLGLLTPEYGRELQGALFPEDARTKEGWEHHWKFGSWSDLARWLTGDAGNAPNLKAANKKLKALKKGAVVFVPYGLLREPLRRFPAPGGASEEREPPPKPAPKPAPKPTPKPKPAPAAEPVGPAAPAAAAPATAAPAGPGPEPEPSQEPAAPAGQTPPAAPPPQAAPPEPEPGAQPQAPPQSLPPAAPAPTAAGGDTARGLLTYGQDGRGRFAVYRLQPGEALYSAVVVRFTGNISAADVNALAKEIAVRSDIADVTDIPIGYPVKIPLEDLLPEYLPPDDARYRAFLDNKAEVDAVRNPVQTAALDGVVVILDAGHGGLDRGAVLNGVWEDSYVYDIVCRIHRGLESRTKARVLLTLMDPTLGLKPQETRNLAPNSSAVILTHPWFRQESTAETKVEVNLRWVLSNQYLERLVKEGNDPARVVFTSVHADSLHPSLRGTMFYVPGAKYRSTSWGLSGDAYKKFAEHRASPTYELTKKELVRSEGLSRQFAAALEAAFAGRGLKLHPFKPTRDHIVRGKRAWVPAVLRNGTVPCSVLVEVCNIANKEDAELLKDPAFRQLVAEAYIDALIAYYS